MSRSTGVRTLPHKKSPAPSLTFGAANVGSETGSAAPCGSTRLDGDARRLTSRQHWDKPRRDVKPIYAAVHAGAARWAFEALADKGATRYPALIRFWDSDWAEFIPFRDYDIEIRKVVCSTDGSESLNVRYRRVIKACGHFPSEQAALNAFAS